MNDVEETEREREKEKAQRENETFENEPWKIKMRFKFCLNMHFIGLFEYMHVNYARIYLRVHSHSAFQTKLRIPGYWEFNDHNSDLKFEYTIVSCIIKNNTFDVMLYQRG